MPEVVEKKKLRKYLITKHFEVEGEDHVDAAENMFMKEEVGAESLVYWVSDLETRETVRVDLAERWNMQFGKY